MAASTTLYRALVRLYPPQFRSHYADDLVLHFDDLVRRDGARRAWCRTTVDLLVTVPRYRMESIMNPRHSTPAVALLVAALALAGLVGYFAGFDHWSSGSLLLYNSIFFTLLLAALVCGVIGIRAMGRPGRSVTEHAG